MLILPSDGSFSLAGLPPTPRLLIDVLWCEPLTDVGDLAVPLLSEPGAAAAVTGHITDVRRLLGEPRT